MKCTLTSVQLGAATLYWQWKEQPQRINPSICTNYAFCSIIWGEFVTCTCLGIHIICLALSYCKISRRVCNFNHVGNEQLSVKKITLMHGIYRLISQHYSLLYLLFFFLFLMSKNNIEKKSSLLWMTRKEGLRKVQFHEAWQGSKLNLLVDRAMGRRA